MNSLNRNKLIGCKIFGNIVTLHENELTVDPERLYEIILNPDQMPQGILVHLKRQEEKKIWVEFPSEICNCNFEKSCSFLLEHNMSLIIKEEGFEKLKNRRLVLEKFQYSDQLLINVLPFIQGRCDGVDYEIELNPYDLSTSSGEIIDPKSKESKKVPLNLDDFKNVKSSELKKILPKLKPNNFQVDFSCAQLTLHLNETLKEYVSVLGKPTKYQNIRENKKVVPYHFLPDEISRPSEKIEVLSPSNKSKEEPSSHLRLTGPETKHNFFGRLWKWFSS